MRKDKKEELSLLDRLLADVANSRRLYLSQEKTFDERIYQLTELEELSIVDSDIQRLPEGIARLTKLRTLAIRDTHLRKLPEDIVELQNLIMLCIIRTKISALPPTPIRSVDLNYLDLSGNKLSELPDYLGDYAKLEHIRLEKTPLKVFPACLFRLPKWRKAECKGCTGFHKNFQSTGQGTIFLQNVYLRGEVALREELYRIFSADDALCADISWAAILSGVQFSTPAALRQSASRLLQQRIAASYAQNPLRKGAIFGVLGKPAMGREELQEKMEAQGVAFRARWTEDCTHILLGAGFSSAQRQKIADLSKSNKCPQLMLDEQVSAFLRESGEFYLTPAAAEAAADGGKQAAQYADSLRQLLLSRDDNNIALALEMMQAGGVPESLHTELFMTAKSANFSRENIKVARELLKKFAPKALYEFAKSNRSLAAYEGYLTPSVYAGLLRDGLLDWRSLYAYDRRCSRHAMEHAHWLKMLSLQTGMEYLQTHFAADPQATLRLCQLPVDLQAQYCPLPLIKRAEFSYSRPLPPILEEMPQVEFFRCGHLNDKSLPQLERLKGLPNLQDLEFSSFFAERIPDFLFSMPKLRSIVIEYWYLKSGRNISGKAPENLPADWSYSFNPDSKNWLLQRHEADI